MPKVLGMRVKSVNASEIGQIFPLQTITKKIANTTYCGPPFFQDLRYPDISKKKKMYFNAVFIAQNLTCVL